MLPGRGVTPRLRYFGEVRRVEGFTIALAAGA
jgi:hypothetical protein